MDSGRIEAIFLAGAASGERTAVDEAAATVGVGLEGDAFALGGARDEQRAGGRGDVPRELTLIEAEAIEALATEHGIALEAHEPGRNVVTRGIGLTDLVGKRFRMGEVECLAVELNPPCLHLERRTKSGVLKGLVDGGGIRAEILGDGTLRVGDAVTVL